ncbi:S8 family serine peptidase [Chelativorans salis]|uniref:S8 family serine peptidase n=1 Tax=Chelativorans salis TaxID=2978478 RepID=A0ABT2LK35_9HYPH|nr:S8 family serine peptidase [Chelativorans sp. EGI FJ00035]MCT7374384.1 S8 family serine peptidase [Chelativorans sp. EGI FJ00035]
MGDTIRRLLAGAACAVIAGCGGGGGSSDPGLGTPPPQEPGPSPSPDPEPDQLTLDAAAAAKYAMGREFGNLDPSHNGEDNHRKRYGYPNGCTAEALRGANCASAGNYLLQNIHFAHTAKLPDGTKLRGQGTRIAVLDSGFDVDHQELEDKDIVAYGDLPVHRHGTAAAAVAAGKKDGKGIMGVAPEAGLHLAALPKDNWVRPVMEATKDAAEHGAVVQNNSWGLAEEYDTAANDQLADFNAAGANFADYADFLSLRLGAPAGDLRDLFESYRDFQKTGVIVFANSNDNELGAAVYPDKNKADVEAWAALPVFPGYEDLREAWLVVSNAFFTVDEKDGSILDAELLSAPCGSAARFCLTSDGTAHAPNPDWGDDGYGVSSGSSLAAPQVSGMIALLAQAFPDLSPAEWTARLLATARTDWKSFQQSIIGEQTFASGITHAYSSLYGHGLPDMKAALAPVGKLSVASGDNVFSGKRTSLAAGIATAAPVIGNGVAKAIAGREVMVIDALGTDFYVPGKALGGKAAATQPAGTADARDMVGNVEQVAGTFAFMERGGGAPVPLHDVTVPKLFFSQSLGHLGGKTAFSRLFPLNGKGRFLQLAGHIGQEGDGSDAAFSLSRLAASDKFATELSFSFGHSAGGFFGAETRGPFVAANNTGSAAAGLSFSAALPDGWSVGVYAELGSSFVRADPTALVDYGASAYASGGLTARRRGVITGRDTVDLYAGVQPRPVAGKADVHLPVGRKDDGTILYDKLTVDLAEADMPLRLGLVYRNRTNNDFDMLFGLNTDFTASREPDPALSLSLGLKKTF